MCLWVCVLNSQTNEQQVEQFNRLRDFFGDPAKRWDDRLDLHNKAFTEEYICGRAALVLHCDIETVSTLYKRKPIVPEVEIASQPRKRSMLVILKAHIFEHHKLEHWNKKLMFVDDIKVIQSPESKIPSLVGLYNIENEIANLDNDALLFKSLIKSTYKLIPRVSNRKSGPFCCGPITKDDRFVVQEVQCTPEIVQGISDNNGILALFQRGLDVEAKQILSTIEVLLDGQFVEVRTNKSLEAS